MAAGVDLGTDVSYANFGRLAYTVPYVPEALSLEELSIKYSLTSDELEAVETLHKAWTSGGDGRPMPPGPSPYLRYIKVLAARKWDVERALELLAHYVELFEEYGVENGAVTYEQALPILSQGLCHLLGRERDTNVFVFFFMAERFLPEAQPPATVVLGLWYVLDYVLDHDPPSLRNGIALYMDGKGMGWKNFSPDLEKIMVGFLQDRFPVRLRRIALLRPPWYINAMITILSAFMKKKTREKIVLISDITTLNNRLEDDSIPTVLGGPLVLTSVGDGGEGEAPVVS